MNLNFKIILGPIAEIQFKSLIKDPSKKVISKAILKTLKLMQENLKHPSLNTHKYSDIKGPQGEEIFESYVQNNTPGAYRIFWYYGPGRGIITVLAITSHP